jgi:hypothetical protein
MTAEQALFLLSMAGWLSVLGLSVYLLVRRAHR